MKLIPQEAQTLIIYFLTFSVSVFFFPDFFSKTLNFFCLILQQESARIHIKLLDAKMFIKMAQGSHGDWDVEQIPL